MLAGAVADSGPACSSSAKVAATERSSSAAKMVVAVGGKFRSK